MTSDKRGSTYAELGVSSGKEEVHAATKNLDKGVFPGAFCKALPDIAGSEDHCNIIHADGAGTKSSLAWLYWKETGDIRVFRGIAQDSMAMNIDDMVAVGATGPFVMSNTIGRSKHQVPGEVIAEIIAGYEDTANMLGKHGIEIRRGGGETADVGDLVRTAIVDSTFFTRMPRKDFINCANVKSGHVIVAFASDGQATYETSPNSGMGSNGLTAARHNMLGGGYAGRYPEAYAPEIAGKAYQGEFRVTDAVPGLPMNFGLAVLSPTRLHAPMMKAVLDAHRGDISAIFHNTGGGQKKCLGFGSGVHYIKANPMPIAPLFQLIQERTQLPLEEMVSTFNMGSRMEVVCRGGAADGIRAIAKSFGIGSQIIGDVQPYRDGERALTIKYPGETLRFGS